MQYRILGSLELSDDDGGLVEVAGAKQRALLAVLVLNANQIVSGDRLIEALWEAEPPETAPKALQVHVSQLRKLLGKRLETRAPGYLLRVEAETLDLHRFQRLREAGALDEALSLWRGPPLAEFAYQEFAQAEIARLQELRLSCLEERIEQDLARGRHGLIVGELEALVNDHPLREQLSCQLMLALYRSGRQAEALETYQQARAALVDQLGIDPGHELRELHQQILRQDRNLDLTAEVEPATEVERGAFVGRESELAVLLSGLEDAFAGRGRLFLLGGEPGIGKTRLAEELIAHARARGARVLIGRCWEAGGAPAFWPWMQALRSYIRETDSAALGERLGGAAVELAQILPELRELLPGLPEPLSLESEGARFRLFDATAGFLRSTSMDQPIVLFLDDLHAADAPSLLLFQFLARELGNARILALGAYRDLDPIPSQLLTTTFAEIAREPATHRLSLSGLSEGDVASYVALTATGISSTELVAALHEETDGNPLFVGEIVRLASVEGGGSEPGAKARLAVPQSVRDVISRRLAHLSDECNRILRLASVIGREFALNALAEVSGISEGQLLDELDEAMTARVVSDVPDVPERLRFSHVLIRDTLYEGLTTARRVRLHRRVVETLEALYGDQSARHLTELAHHSIAGSDFGKGLHYARRAAEQARASLAYEEAVRLYEMALDALDLAAPESDNARCELLLALGDAESAGDSLAAKRTFLEAANIARRLDLPHELARAAAGYGGRMPWARAGGDDQLVPLLEAGLEAIADSDVALRARLLARLAGALRDEHSRDRRDGLSNEAVELARRTGNLAALAYALDGRAAAIIAPDTVDECLALGTELRDVALSIGDAERVLAGHWNRFIAQVMLGDLVKAELDLAAATRIADDLGLPVEHHQVLATRAMLAMTTGRFVEAEELIVTAFAIGERAQPEMAVPTYALHRHTLNDLQGDSIEVERSLQELIAKYPARPVFRCALVHLHARQGNAVDARRTLDDLAQDDFSTLPFDQEWLYSMSLVAETCVLLNDSSPAATLYGMLEPWAMFNAADHPEAIRGSVSRYLGLLAENLGREDEAAGHYEVALEQNATMGVRPWCAHTQRDFARLLQARDAAGDGERAIELLEAAVITYRELGMHADEAGAASMLLGSGPTTT